MILFTMIARVADGLTLACSMHDDEEQVRFIDIYMRGHFHCMILHFL
jgi:hypothetical protein